MKMSEIEVGVEYAVGNEKYPNRVKVLEKGVYGTVRGMWRNTQSTHPNYVKVEFVTEREGSEVRTDEKMPRQFITTWSEWVRLKEEAKQAELDREAPFRTAAIMLGGSVNYHSSRHGTHPTGVLLPLAVAQKLIDELDRLRESDPDRHIPTRRKGC